MEFNSIELLFDSTCVPINLCTSSPDIQRDELDLQDGQAEDASELIKFKDESDQCTDLTNDHWKGLDSYDQIKAPANCFLLYRSHVLKEITAQNPGHSSRSITSIIAENWKNEPFAVKSQFKELAAKEKAQFKKRFPEYRRVVKPKIRKRAASFRKTFVSNMAFPDTPSNVFCNGTSLLFSSFAGRRRSYSMPELPDALKRPDFSSKYNINISSPLGPLLPLNHLNPFKKSLLSKAFGNLN